MENLPERIVVVGAGGMGALFGAILQDGGLSVTLYDTNAAQVDAIERDGLRISGYGGERTVEIRATSDPMEIESADVLLFQCKAHLLCIRFMLMELKSKRNFGCLKWQQVKKLDVLD